MDELNPRKRPRPVVSCLRCRDKKLKCDRSSPCENCVKVQLADSCTYQRGLNMASKESPSVSSSNINVVEDLQARLARVEGMLGIRGSYRPTSNDSTEEVKPHAIGTVVVKGSRSIFHGQCDRTTLLNQVWATTGHSIRFFTCVPVNSGGEVVFRLLLIRNLTFHSSWKSRNTSMRCPVISKFKLQQSKSSSCRTSQGRRSVHQRATPAQTSR